MSKVLGIDARCLEWQRGGVSRFLVKFLEQAPYFNLEWKFILYFQNYIPEDDFLKHPNFTNKLVRGPGYLKKRRILCEQILLPFAVWPDKVDVFFAPWYTAPLLLLSKPVFVGAWDISFLTHPSHYTLSSRISLGFFGKITYRKSKGLVTCSEYDARQIESFLNIAPEKICTLNLPAENKFDQFVDAKRIEQTLQVLGIRKRYILSLGVIYNRRNIPALIKAFANISHEIPDVQLVIVGRDATSPKVNIKEMLAPLINSGRAVYLDFLQEEYMLPVYKGAILYYCTSDVDGESILLKEAMRSGIPIVTSELLREATNEYGTYIADPADPQQIQDAILSVVRNEDGIMEKVEKGIAWNRTITWETAIKKAYTFINNQ